ncbi:WD40 repeat-like protein, partial [Pluteus cervinus]
MSYSKKSNQKRANQPNPEMSAALLHILNVRIPATSQTNNRLHLDITDGDSNHPNIKPHQFYHGRPPKKVDGSEVVLSVERNIPIQGTHLVLEIMELHTFHQNKTLFKVEVLWEDILCVLKQSDQEVVMYTIPNTQVKLTTKKESLLSLLQHAVLPKSLLESLGRAGVAMNVLIEIGDPLSQLHPTAQLVFGLLKSVVAIFEKQKLCYEKLSGLFERMASLYPCFEQIKSLKNFGNVQQAIEPILAHMEAALKAVLKHSTFNSLKQFLDFIVSPPQADQFSELSDKFDKLLVDYNTALQLDMAIAQDQLLENAAQSQVEEALKKLNYVKAMPGNGCLENTRVSTLADIENWAQNNPKQPVLWLCGPAGTGKSTIATTVISKFEESKTLGAFYTCRRDHKSFRDPLQLWRNICYMLGVVYKPFGLQVAEVIRSDSYLNFGTETIHALFQKLFKQPLAMLDADPPVEPLVVVIDALDECGTDVDRIQLLTCLLELTKLCSWIKIVVTSRNNPEIQQCLKDCAYQVVLDTTTSSDDVGTFIRTQFISFQLSDTVIFQLIKAANGLFIWADTVFKCLQESLDYDETAQLLLKSQSNESNEIYKQLHNLYHMVITSGVGNSSSNQTVFRKIMSTVLLAAQPLLVSTLSKLTQCKIEIVERIVTRLHAVIMVSSDGTVRILHPSFAEYLLNKENHSKNLLWVDSHSGHSALVDRCFDILKKELKFNIYDIPSSYVLNKDVEGLEKHKNNSGLLHVHYAALFWTFHMQECRQMTIKQEERLLDIFGGPHALYWMEVLSLHDKIYDALRGIQGIQQMKVIEPESQVMEANSKSVVKDETQMILQDLYYFLGMAKGVASISIPHIYISCLAYMPQGCQLGQRLLPFFGNLLKLQGIPNMWIPYNLVLEGHTKGVLTVAYSPDGKFIVSGSEDKTVRIWDSNTGQPVVQPLVGHSSWVGSVAYSPDGKYVASGSGDRTVRIWNVVTGQPVGQPFEGHNGAVRSVAYSPNGKHVISGSYDKTIKIWDTNTGQPIGQPFQGHTDWVMAVAYSPNGKHVISGSQDKTVKIWDANTGLPVGQPLEGHSINFVKSVAYSLDGKYIVSGSYDKTVRIWDANTGQPVGQPLEGHDNWVLSVAYSPDSRHVASGSSDETVRIWDINTGQLIGQALEGHSDWVTCVAYSPDGQYVVSGSGDRTVRIWD